MNSRRLRHSAEQTVYVPLVFKFQTDLIAAVTTDMSVPAAGDTLSLVGSAARRRNVCDVFPHMSSRRIQR